MLALPILRTLGAGALALLLAAGCDGSPGILGTLPGGDAGPRIQLVDGGGPPADGAASPRRDGRPPSRPDSRPPPRADSGGPSGACGNAAESEVFRLTNQERTSRGLGALACDPAATAVARAYSQAMCDGNFFSHTGKDGTQPWDRLRAGGVRFSGAGENIAKGYPSPAAVMRGWMNSTGHRTNILRTTWRRIGVGYVLCRGRTTYWTQNFMM